MKSLAPVPAGLAPAVKQPPPVVLRGAPAPGPEQGAPAASVHALAAPSGEPDAAPIAAKKDFPGARPAGLAASRNGARDGARDDLTKIKGMGPKSLDKLHALGVFHFDQIAAWNLDNAKWIGAAISAPGRVERGKWIQQARDLAAAARNDAPKTS